MKISGSTKSSSLNGARRTGASSKGAGGFRVDGASIADAAAQAAPTAPSEMLGALINLQAQASGERALIEAGEKALDLLDGLRLALLDGAVSQDDLERLADAAGKGAKRASPGDNAIADAYNDIALRARVELAKLGR
ncbi:MAG: flagellar assembly protein FliX [Pseudomonadota bacterium]